MQNIYATKWLATKFYLSTHEMGSPNELLKKLVSFYRELAFFYTILRMKDIAIIQIGAVNYFSPLQNYQVSEKVKFKWHILFVI